MTDTNSVKPETLKTSGDEFAAKPLKDKIGNDLKQLYDDVVNEDVPDDFLALLAKADQHNN